MRNVKMPIAVNKVFSKMRSHWWSVFWGPVPFLTNKLLLYWEPENRGPHGPRNWISYVWGPFLCKNAYGCLVNHSKP